MKRFYTAIVRRRRLVLAVFALAAVLSMARHKPGAGGL